MPSKRCPRCTLTLPLSSFYRDASRVDGRAPYCKRCRYEMTKGRKRVDLRRGGVSEEQRRAIASSRKTKVCTRCEERKPVGQFSPALRGRYGVRSRCRRCMVEVVRAYRKVRRSPS